MNEQKFCYKYPHPSVTADWLDTPEKRQWYERYCEMRPIGISRK